MTLFSVVVTHVSMCDNLCLRCMDITLGVLDLSQIGKCSHQKENINAPYACPGYWAENNIEVLPSEKLRG